MCSGREREEDGNVISRLEFSKFIFLSFYRFQLLLFPFMHNILRIFTAILPCTVYTVSLLLEKYSSISVIPYIFLPSTILNITLTILAYFSFKVKMTHKACPGSPLKPCPKADWGFSSFHQPPALLFSPTTSPLTTSAASLLLHVSMYNAYPKQSAFTF